MFLPLWRGVNPERLACLQGRPLYRSIDASGILEQESPADTTVTRDSAIIPTWLPATILDFIEPQIGLAPFDPLTPKTITYPNMEWIGCTVCEIFAFKLYCDLETGVLGHSRSSNAALFDTAHTTLYSSSIVTMHIYYRFRDIAAYWSKTATPLVFGAPIGGEAPDFRKVPW